MFRILGPKGGLIVRRATATRVKAILPALRKRFGKITVIDLNAPKPITMYDSVTPEQIPADAQAVAGYVNGHWPTYAGLAKSHPRALRLSIAVNASADAECLDIEAGNATSAQAPAWVKRQIARGVKRPVLYCSLSEANKVLKALSNAGLSRWDVRLWTAHYTHEPHRCYAKCGFGFTYIADATQYTDRALGRNLDASLCNPRFFTKESL